MTRDAKPTAITLIRHCEDKGERLEIAPTMKEITIKGQVFWRDNGIQFTYPDGVRSVAYLAKVGHREFFKPLIDRGEVGDGKGCL